MVKSQCFELEVPVTVLGAASKTFHGMYGFNVSMFQSPVWSTKDGPGLLTTGQGRP